MEKKLIGFGPAENQNENMKKIACHKKRNESVGLSAWLRIDSSYQLPGIGSVLNSGRI